jgi:hypothetical protein
VLRFAILMLAYSLVRAADIKEIEVTGARLWTDTGIDVEAGEILKVEVEGRMDYAGLETGPDGLDRTWRDLMKKFPLNDAPRGALIGRVGDSAATRPFLIGTRAERTAHIRGRLYLGINAAGSDATRGIYRVKLQCTKPAAAVVSKESMLQSLVRVRQDQLDSVPRRVVDADGTEGDRTNFLIVGSEEEVVGALERAGWVTVDKTVKESILRGIMVTLSKGAYVTMPMSELLVYGRGQDYGWAQGDPVMVVAARHHFRIWKAPFTAGDRTVWVGAGTHDIGFEKDQRNGKLTHKIDPNVDEEREYIGHSLELTGEVLLLDPMTPKDPVKEAKTAHGAAYRSDGRTLIIYLRPQARAAESQIANR